MFVGGELWLLTEKNRLSAVAEIMVVVVVG